MKILFIGHDAGRTGAPILLLNLMRWMKTNSNISFDLLLLNGGQLEEECKSISKVYKRQSTLIKRANKIIKTINYLLNLNIKTIDKFNLTLIKELKKGNYDLIYGNTIVSSTAINNLIKYMPNPNAIIHIHELNDITQNYSNEFKHLINSNVHFITASKLTEKNLIVNHNVSSNIISIIYEYIDTKKVLISKSIEENTKFIVNGSGYVQIRKGYDIFLSIAKRAISKYPNIPFEFVWVGELSSELNYYIKNDIEQSGLSNYVNFIGGLENPYQKFSQSSVFLLTSRQDPFPLVCLEHALLEKPIICFDKGTGITEFVENDAGIIVPYMDTEAAADALALLFSNKTLLNGYGKTASKKALNYDINIQAKKIIELINIKVSK